MAARRLRYQRRVSRVRVSTLDTSKETLTVARGKPPDFATPQILNVTGLKNASF
jgi:hypothetical protein